MVKLFDIINKFTPIVQLINFPKFQEEDENKSFFKKPTFKCIPVKCQGNNVSRSCTLKFRTDPRSPILMKTVYDDEAGKTIEDQDWTMKVESSHTLEKLQVRVIEHMRKNFGHAGGVVLDLSHAAFNCKRNYDLVKSIKFDTGNIQKLKIKDKEDCFATLDGEHEMGVDELRSVIERKPASSFQKELSIDDYLTKYGSQPPVKDLTECINLRVRYGPTFYVTNLEKSLCDDSSDFDLRTLPDLLDIFRMVDNNIHGVTTPYLYISIPGTFFGFHLEDENLQSINLMWDLELKNHPTLKEGTKVWILIDQRDQELFKDVLMKEFGGDNVCRDLLVIKDVIPNNLESLAKEGVRFQVVEQRPGMLVITQGIHGGYNTGVCFNEAVNIAFPQYAGLNLTHDYDELLKRDSRQRCTCKNKAHRGNDYVSGYSMRLGKIDEGWNFKDLVNTEKLAYSCYIPEIIINEYSKVLDKFDTLTKYDDNLNKRRKRFIRSIIYQLIEKKTKGVSTRNYTVFDPNNIESWELVRKHMGSTEIKTQYGSNYEIIESKEEMKIWAMTMQELYEKNKDFKNLYGLLITQLSTYYDHIVKRAIVEKPQPPLTKPATKRKTITEKESAACPLKKIMIDPLLSTRTTRSQSKKPDAVPAVEQTSKAKPIDPKKNAPVPPPQIPSNESLKISIPRSKLPQAAVPSNQTPSTGRCTRSQGKKSSNTNDEPPRIISPPSQDQLMASNASPEIKNRFKELLNLSEGELRNQYKTLNSEEKTIFKRLFSPEKAVEPVDPVERVDPVEPDDESSDDESSDDDDDQPPRIPFDERKDVFLKAHPFKEGLVFSSEENKLTDLLVSSKLRNVPDHQMPDRPIQSSSFLLMEMCRGKQRLFWNSIDEPIQIIEGLARYVSQSRNNSREEWNRLRVKINPTERANKNWSRLIKNEDKFRDVNRRDTVARKLDLSFEVFDRLGKNTGVPYQRLSFVLHSFMDSFMANLDIAPYPFFIDQNYVDRSAKINKTRGMRISVPSNLAHLYPGCEVDQDWDSTVEWLRNNWASIFKIDDDKEEAKNEETKSITKCVNEANRRFKLGFRVYEEDIKEVDNEGDDD